MKNYLFSIFSTSLLLRYTFSTLLLVGFFACETPTETPTTGTITGKVTDQKTGVALSGVTVSLSNKRSVVTSADGSYSLSSVPLGVDQSVTYSKTNYISQTASITIATGSTSATKSVQLSLKSSKGRTTSADTYYDYKGAVVGSSGAFRVKLTKNGDQWTGKITMIVDGNRFTLAYISSVQVGQKYDHTFESQGKANMVEVTTNADGTQPSIKSLKLDGHPDAEAVIEMTEAEYDPSSGGDHPNPDKEVLVFEGFSYDSVKDLSGNLLQLAASHYNILVKGGKVQVVRKSSKVIDGIEDILYDHTTFVDNVKRSEKFDATITKDMAARTFVLTATLHGAESSYNGRFEMEHGQVTKLIFDDLVYYDPATDKGNSEKEPFGRRLKKPFRKHKPGYATYNCPTGNPKRYYPTDDASAPIPDCATNTGFVSEEVATTLVVAAELTYTKQSLSVSLITVDHDE